MPSLSMKTPVFVDRQYQVRLIRKWQVFTDDFKKLL